jgi:hypothetical protein
VSGGRAYENACLDLFRYVLYRSYVLLVEPVIEPITERIPDQVPLGKAQRLDGRAYESPALPLSYSAAGIKLIERDPERQPRSIEHITLEQDIPVGPVETASSTQSSCPTGVPRRSRRPDADRAPRVCVAGDRGERRARAPH